MAIIPDKVQIGTSSDYLDGVSVYTPAGNGLFRETVVNADPENGSALARVRNSDPASDDYGTVTRVAGNVNALALNSLVPTQFDDIELIYTGDDLTSVVYRSDAVVVATLTLTYSSGSLSRVVRT